ncbi:MAG: hypothetical protein PVG11_03735 [Anaerolineae bacterium]|jgi:hypothetical protein
MPTTARAFVKASLLYLGAGAILGALLFIQRWIPLDTGLLALRESHVQCVVVGWLTQLILGVAWWLFPPLPAGHWLRSRAPERRGQFLRGSEPLFWATFIALNAGILLRAICAPLHVWTQITFFEVLAGISGIFLLAAAATFLFNMWGRVRALGQGS